MTLGEKMDFMHCIDWSHTITFNTDDMAEKKPNVEVLQFLVEYKMCCTGEVRWIIVQD
jgi:hypothetical protein